MSCRGWRILIISVLKAEEKPGKTDPSSFLNEEGSVFPSFSPSWGGEEGDPSLFKNEEGSPSCSSSAEEEEVVGSSVP